MAISERTVQNKRTANGTLTGKPGTVYDVNIKYRENGRQKTYAKRGFSTKKEAQLHEAEMKLKFDSGGYSALDHKAARQKLKEFLPDWIQKYGPSNLRPSTYAGYRAHIKNQIVPLLGEVRLCDLTPAMIDDMIARLSAQGLAPATVRYCQRILSSSLECAVKYGYVQTNAAKNIMTRLSIKPQEPLIGYTIPEMQQFMAIVAGTKWEMIGVLAGLYGLRRSEVLGLRWQNVDLENNRIDICEQLPFGTKSSDFIIEKMAPLKSKDDGFGRSVPITPITRHYFIEQQEKVEQQKKLCQLAGKPYYDNNLVCCKPDGRPWIPSQISNEYGQVIRRSGLRHIRLHDLRRTTSTNCHNLTGDYFTIGQIMGHTLESMTHMLGVTAQINTVTARYITVREQRKLEVLNAYHQALLAPSTEVPVLDGEKSTSATSLQSETHL